MRAREFEFIRLSDESGVSGTGRVAEGIMFSDGSCAVRWLTKTRSTATYASFADVVAIHGHGGKTLVRFIGADGKPLAHCSHCLHPFDDHWMDNCGGCATTGCTCTLMGHPERVAVETNVPHPFWRKTTESALPEGVPSHCAGRLEVG